MSLSVAKLRAGQHRYYLEVVAAGWEDHRASGLEPDGDWHGAGAKALGLSGRVEEPALAAVLAGADPETGEQLRLSPTPVSVTGYDLTFGAPKAVSLLFALGDGAVASEVLAGHAAAVTEVAGYVEREVARARRGSGPERAQVPVTGVTAAGFVHRTSRLADPHLHTHLLLANLGQDLDGRWSALDGRRLYIEIRTLGVLYHAHLRHELVRRLGVVWTPDTSGCLGLEGVSREIRRAFSRRRQEIESWLDSAGRSGPAASRVAALATRAPKDPSASFAALRPWWSARARALGLGPEELAAVVGRGPRAVGPPDDLVAIARRLVGPDGLTRFSSAFSRSDVVRSWCAALPAGVPVQTVEALADELLASGAVVGRVRGGTRLRRSDAVRRADGQVVWGGGDSRRWTTVEVAAAEREASSSVERRRHEGVAMVAAGTGLASTATQPPGSDAVLVSRLLSSGAGVEVMTGELESAGPVLAAAAAAWAGAGYRVTGAAPSRRSAAELAATAGIEAETVASLLSRSGGQARSGVLVVSDAGTLPARDLARLLEGAERSGTKLVLLGTSRGLGEDYMDAFRRLSALDGTLELPSRPAITREDRRLAGPTLAELGPALDELRQSLSAGLPPDTSTELRAVAGARAAAARRGPGAADERLEARQADLEESVERRTGWIADHAPELDRLARLQEAIERREATLSRVAAADPPAYLIDALGPVPEQIAPRGPGGARGAAERDRWISAAARVEAYRERWGVTDEASALGERPAAGEQLIAWTRASVDLERAQLLLAREGRGLQIDRELLQPGPAL